MTTEQAAGWSTDRSAAKIAAETYDAAADHYDLPPLGFWARHGNGAVARLGLAPGAVVLDAGCGTGATALPAARTVGNDGFVLGIDVADELLRRAREKASGYANVQFLNRDMTDTGFGDANFDAVISGFSLFFVDDMAALLEEFWRLLRPGGQLLLTTWGPDAFEPGAGVFRASLEWLSGLRNSNPYPWQRISRDDDVRALFRVAGLPEPQIVPVTDRQPLHGPEDWWTIVMGSGFRRDVERLPIRDRETLRRAVLERSAELRSIDTSALHVVAKRPAE